jgi:hypothetical protein
MNKQLRQAIYKKRMLHNTFIKCKNDYNWERYRKQRNKIIKPFLSNKSNNCKKDIILEEDNKITYNDQTEVSEIFNNFFLINVAKDIGSSNTKSDQSHPSI